MNTDFLKKIDKKISFVCIAMLNLFLLSSCIQNALELPSVTSTSLKGKIDGYSASASSLAFGGPVIAMDCSAPRAVLYKIDPSGVRIEPALASSAIGSDGSYSFDVKTIGPVFKGKTPTESLIVQLIGCSSAVYSRPITGPENQDISMGSTVLSFLLNTPNREKLVSVLKSSPKEIVSLLNQLSNARSLNEAYDLFSSNPSVGNQFTQIFGISPNILRQASPEIVSSSIPQNASELVSSRFSVKASHFLSSYDLAYEWRLDGVLIGQSANLEFTPSANQQGTHTLSLVIGENDGAGSVNAALPVQKIESTLTISNNILPVAPALSLFFPVVSGATPINTRNIILVMNTGSNKENCASFSSLALTENTETPPLSSAFNINCTDSGTQNLNYTLSSSGDGIKVLRLWARDSSGEISAVSSVLNVYLDTGAPSLTIHSGPLALTNSSAQTLSFSASDNGGSIDHFECQLDGAAMAICSSPITYSGLSEGSHVFNVKAWDTAGNTSLVETRSWVVDLTPPTLTLSSHPALITNQTASAFVFSAVDAGGGSVSGFLCNLDGAGFSACVSPFNQTLGVGSHNLALKALDTAGNVSAIQTYSWVIDTSAPVVSITSNPVSLTNSTSANFSFVGSDTGGGNIASYSCQLDSGGYSTCTSPVSYSSLSSGSHIFYVKATDTAGNVGAAQSYSWTVDLTTPLASINSGPNSLTNLTSATFTFSANPPPAGSIVGFECNLDNAGWVACSTPKNYTTLSSGSHTFAVRSIDNNGNRSSSSSQTWVVDTTVPILTLDSSPTLINNLTNVSFTFSATDSGGGTVSSYSCKLDSGSFSVCSSPMNFAGLTEGSHTFSVKALDSAGNYSSTQTYSWTTDLTAPTVTITSNPNSVTNSTAANFSFSATDSGGGTVASYKCSLDGQAYSVCSSPKSFSGLTEGLHQVAILAIDSAGNISTASQYNWSVDLTAPTISITSSPNAITNLTSASFVFSGNDTGGGIIASYSCKIDSGAYSSCTSPASYTGLTAGNHTFYISATDSAGNVSNVSSFSWAIDLTAPTVTISTPASNGSVVSTSQLASFTVSGSCSENNQTVTIAGSVSASASCSSGVWTANLNLSGLSDGTLSITATQQDVAGNSSTSGSRTFIKDTVSPVISMATPSAMQGNTSSGAVTWTLSESNVASGTNFTVEIFDGSTWTSLGTKPATSGNNSGQSYSYTGFSVPQVDTSLAKIRVTIADAAGNSTTTTSSSFVIDSTPPTLSSVTINNGATYAGSAVVNVQVSVTDALSSSALWVTMASATGSGECQSQYVNSGWVAWTSSSQNFAFAISPVDGVKKICVWAKDAVGNVTTMSPTTGTAGVNYSTIIRQASSPPQMTSINVYNTNNSTNTFALNDPVTVSWAATGSAGLDNNPIAFAYSTNGSTWFDIVTKADASISANVTWIGGLTGNPTSASGTYTSFTAPTTGYFIIKAVARDIAGNISVVAMSQPQNTGSWSIFAGNTDRGDNGSGLSATLYSDGVPSGAHVIAINPLTNDVYAMDDGFGIRKLNIQTGLVTTYITNGTLNLPNAGTLSSSSRVNVSGSSSMLIDSNGIMYYSAAIGSLSSKIYKINLATNYVEFYMGGGTVNTTSATPSTIYVANGAMDLDASNNLYFMTDCNTTSPSYLTAKKLMMVSQNTDGTPGTFTDIAGNCTTGSITYGQPALSQPLTGASAYSMLSSIAAINPNFIYFSSYGMSTIKIINGTVYSTNVGANSGMGVVTYQRSTNRIYRAVSGNSFGYFTPNNSGNGGETLTTAASSTGPGSCMNEGVDAASACVTVDSGFSFDSNGLVYFTDGLRNNAPSGYRVRYIDSSNQVRTILGSLPFYGDGLSKGLIRGTIGGIYYKKSSEPNQTAFPSGLYLVSPYMVFGRINESDNVYHTLWGNQQGNSYAAPTGTTISSALSMGVPYTGGNGKAMTFDSNGLPWLRESNQLVQVNSSNQVVIKANASGSWWESNANPSTASMYVFGGYQNLTLKGSDGAFVIGGYQLTGSYNPNPQIRFLDFTNILNTQVMGGTYTWSQSTPMSPDITTPGGVQAAPLYYACTNSAACSIQYITSQDRLYFINNGDRYIRYITHPTSPTTSTLTSMATQIPNTYIINFIFKEDLSQIFLLDSRGGLYCMDISSGKSWCNNTTNLYPYSSTMGVFSYGANQMTWKDSSTLLISNYKGQILQYVLPP